MTQISTFADFNLSDSILKALSDLGFTAPTMVQSKAVPVAMTGRDLLVSSQTGSGKTVAFLLPTINDVVIQLSSPDNLEPAKRHTKLPAPKVLVLCPTRELAQQVAQDAINLVRHVRGLRVASVMGGMPFIKQIQGLKGAQVLIATPGRLLDLVNRRQLDLSEVRSLIVDEADRMLDLGFSEDLEEISHLAKNRKQTLMFSATFAGRIIQLATNMMNDPERISIETGHSTNADVTQTLHWTDGFEHKKKLLSHWLSDETMDQAVVFANTQSDTELLADELAAMGHQVIALHGAMPQNVRMRRIKSLRDGRVRVLVATDVAARGLDISTITHVINFGLPMKTEDYVHRIGRTGRAGRTGQAITLATHRERSKVRALEDYLKTRLAVSEVPGLEPNPAPIRSSDRHDRGGKGGNRGNDRYGYGSRGGFSGGRSEGNTYGDRPARREFNNDRPLRQYEDRPARPFEERVARPEGGFGAHDRSGRSEVRDNYPRAAASGFNSDRSARTDRSPNRERSFNNDDNRGNRIDVPRQERRFDSSTRPAFRSESSRPSREGSRDGGFIGRSDRNDSRSDRPVFNRERESRSFNRDNSGESRRFADSSAQRRSSGDRIDRPRRDFGAAKSTEVKFGAGARKRDLQINFDE